MLGAVDFTHGAEARLNITVDIGMGAEIRFLRQVVHRGAGLKETFAAVLLDQTSGNFQQGGFARAIAADKADAFIIGQCQFSAFQQRSAAKTQADVFQ